MSAETWRSLADALQEFANETADEGAAPLVTQALIVWEQLTIEDGQTMRQVRYTVPSDNFSLSGAVGLAETARAILLRDTLGGDL